ncbi:MAG: Flp1 family type IVb pilin [Eubacteriales bacterium]|nr:Flp1 family type IVb pilin [Eubacteriales bacterium]
MYEKSLKSFRSLERLKQKHASTIRLHDLLAWTQGRKEEQPRRSKIKAKLSETEALGTVEIVLIIAILIAIALIFREAISNFAKDLIAKVFDHSIIDQVTYD